MRSTRHARLVTLAGATAAATIANFLSSVRADTPAPIADIWTWGLGTAGQLGPARPNATVPAPNHTTGRWIMVSAGNSHTLALNDAGEVWAWGSNDHGQLGDGSTTQSLLPVRVLGLTGITKIAAGGSHSLAYRASDASLWGWGSNSDGQLARDPSSGDALVPVDISGLGSLVGLAGGRAFTLVLDANGDVWGFGDNALGELGVRDFDPHSSPVKALLPGPAVAVGAGSAHSLAALASGGAVYTWGWNVFGELGRGYQGTPGTGEAVPAPAVGVSDAVEVSGGDFHCLARTSDGHVWAWGYNTEGQVGNGQITAANTGVLSPVELGIDSVTAIDAGGIHSVVLRAGGEVWSWGNGQFGACGENGRADEHLPVRAIDIGPAAAVTAGGKFSVAIAAPRPAARVLEIGISGTSTALPSSRPAVRALSALTDVSMVSSGDRHTLALDGNHRVWSWGDNSRGQLGTSGPGRDDPQEVPVPLESAEGFVAVAARASRSFALRSDGTVWAWGDNSDGQLGFGTTDATPSPARISSLSAIVAIAVGYQHVLAEDDIGLLWGWGRNDHGQLGIAASAAVRTPMRVPLGSGPQAIAAGAFSSFALGGGGELISWGAGTRGQLAHANPSDTEIPDSVSLPKKVTSLAGGRDHTLVVLSGGDVWGFGDNSACQLGLAPLVYSFTNEPVNLGVSRAVSVHTGEYHSVVVTADHAVLSWGDDTGGQLGQGDVLWGHYDCDALGLGLGGATAVAGGNGRTIVALDHLAASVVDAGDDGARATPLE